MMKRVRWTHHALQNLIDREIERAEADQTIAHSEFTLLDPPDRKILMRRYFDQLLCQEMLLRIVIEETSIEITIITVYKTSQISRYLRGLVP